MKRNRSILILKIFCFILVAFFSVKMPLISDAASDDKEKANILRLENSLNQKMDEELITKMKYRSKYDYSLSQFCDSLRNAAKDHGYVITRVNSITKNKSGSQYIYTVSICNSSYLEAYFPTSMKEAYEDTLSILKNMEYEKVISDDKLKYENGIEAAFKQHPEYQTSVLSIIKYTKNTNYYQISLREGISFDEVKERQNEVLALAESITDSIITKEMNDSEKARVIHDYILAQCEFHSEAEENASFDDLSYTAYGCLIQHKALCMGYAASFNLLSDMAGLKSIAVSSYNMEKHTGHAWNYICLDDSYVYVDCTWDDLKMDSGSYSTRYFAVDEETISADHAQWDKDIFSKKWIAYL